jgi:hypothetical protein
MSVPDMHTLAAIRVQAEFAGAQAKGHFKKWFLAVHRLALLKECEVYQFWASASLAENVAFLRDCAGGPLQGAVKKVVKVQREIAREKKAMRECEATEKRLHGQYVAGMRYVITKQA